MIKYILRQFKNSNSSINNKWLAYPVIDETVGLDGLSEHMSNHNTPFSAGAIKGMLTDMIGCIKEILLQGKNVKLPDLAIFSIGIKNKRERKRGGVQHHAAHQGRKAACPCHRNAHSGNSQPRCHAEEGYDHRRKEERRCRGQEHRRL